MHRSTHICSITLTLSSFASTCSTKWHAARTPWMSHLSLERIMNANRHGGWSGLRRVDACLQIQSPLTRSQTLRLRTFIGKRLQTFTKTKMASSVVDLPKDTLRIMQTVLTRLQKSRGPVSMEKLWSGVAVNDVRKTRTAHKKSDVGEGGALRTLENAKDAFELLARSCGERLASLRTELRTLPSRPGLHSLSDEILSNIFERVLYNTRDNQIKETIEIVFGHAMRYFCRTGDDLKLTIEVTLSHVGRRFRKLSLSNPKLWTRVCSLMHQTGSVCASSAQRMLSWRCR
ncbi:hypothetical protein DFH11DRAFT_551957 [Phellopilus nigrolimitatus]|nr:hypothetical protein DFH11DRAFT_551957 [Phellopilus nigrolimitatus]